MEEERKGIQNMTVYIESGPKLPDDDQAEDHGLASAHIIGNDSWQQVGLMLITSFNCGWILSFSNLMLVPLGWAWGISCLIGFGLFTAYANWLLAAFHFVEGQRFIRYRDQMGFLFGKEMHYVTWFSQFVTMVLSNMGNILLGGKALKEINAAFSDSTLRLQYYIMITGASYFVFSFVVPNLSAMRKSLIASSFLTFGYIGFVLVILIKDGKTNHNKDYTVSGSTDDKVFNAFAAISTIIVCNTSGMLPEIQSTLKKPAVRNMRKALLMQFTWGLILYYGVSIAGYWAYGSQVPDYLPKQLSGPKWVKVLINAAVFLQNIISQHMFLQPVHEALDTKFLNLNESTYSKQNLRRRLLLRTLLFSGNTLVTAAIPFMGDFINLLGSFTLVPLTFIFPSMIFLKVKWKTAKPEKKAWHWIIIFVSSIIGVLTTISAVRSVVKHIQQYHFFADA